MKSNKFSKALKHLKSTELDEKIKRLEEAAPTNSIGGVYALNQPGHRLGPLDPPRVFYADVDGTWPAGIPGTPGERTYTRPAGYWDSGPGSIPAVDWDRELDFSHSDTSTDGFIDATTGTVLSNLPPDSSNFILGPLVDGYVYNHGYDDFTNIGYIQKDTRQFILLGRITGYWQSGVSGLAISNTNRQWGGTETGFTSYNENFTLAMAQWFRDQYNAGTYTKNVSYYYSGGYPQSGNPDPDAPPGSKGGAVAGAGNGGGAGDGPFGSGGNPSIGGQQNPPNNRGPKDAGFPWELFGKLKDWLFGDDKKKKKKPDEKYGPAFGDDEKANKERDKLIKELERNMDQYKDDPKVKNAVKDWNDALYKAGGGKAAQEQKGQSRKEVIEQGRKNVGLPPTPPPKGGQGSRPLGDTTQRGGSGSGDSGSSGGGLGGARGGSQKNPTREVVKPSKKGGLPVKTVYRGMPEKSADLTRKFGTKETGTTMGRKGVSVSSKPEVARSYADENPLTRGTPVGNKTGEVWKGRIPANAGSSFRGVTVVSKQVADTAFKNNISKEAQPPKRSGARPKAGTSIKVTGLPGGGGSSGIIQPIEPWIGKTDPLQGYTYDYKSGKYKLANSQDLQGEVLSESKKRILREIKQPYKLPEQPKQKYKMNFKGKFSPQNTPDVTACKESDEGVKAQNAAGQTWRTKDKYWSRYQSTERMNVIYDQVGHGSQYWDMIVNENQNKKGVRDRKIQEQLNIIAHEKAMLQEDPNYVSPFRQNIEEQETLQADKDPLFKKVSKKLKKEIDYPDKPSKAGYPNIPPPEPVNGWHPDYGNKGDYYNKLDPQSAEAMPSTGNSEIDAKVQKAKRIKKILGKKA